MTRTQLARALGVAVLAASLGACDFTKSVSSNPNAVPSASVDQLFTSIQVNTFFFAENEISRMTSMWTQQMAGSDRQFSAVGTYQFGETDADGEFSSLYTGGGLIDLRNAEKAAAAANRPAYQGILEIYEAYLMGMGASLWGDLPYSTALDPSKPATLDKQQDVYAAVQKLLDDAITKLGSGTGGPGTADLVFGGNAAKWTAVAHTLKARYYLHWAKAEKMGASAQAQTACGGDCIQEALAETAKGIQSPSGNWVTIHTTNQKEANAWYQFMNDRSGYIVAGSYLVNLLQSRNDPRLAIYFAPTGSGQFVGSAPGENNQGASTLSQVAPNGFGLPQHSTAIVSCAENQFIAAEANYYLGNTAAAQSALQAGVNCQQTEYGISIPIPSAPSSLTGSALLTEIMTQKYIASFLNENALSDYERTCIPAIQTFQGKTVPQRLYYGQTERQTNPNIPDPAQQPLRNTNDPVGCMS